MKPRWHARLTQVFLVANSLFWLPWYTNLVEAVYASLAGLRRFGREVIASFE